MIRTRLFLKTIAWMGMVVVLTLTLAGSARAQESAGDSIGPAAVVESIQPSELNALPDGPAYYSLSMFDFTPYDWAQGRLFDTAMLVNPHQSQAFYIAPLHLPQGAQINKAVMFYIDNADPYLDIEFYLLICPLAADVCSVVASGESAHAYETPRVMDIVPYSTLIIDNHLNSYLLDIVMDPAAGIGITGARIDYGYPVSLPIIHR